MLEFIIHNIIFFSILLPSGYLLGKYISENFNPNLKTTSKLQFFFEKIEDFILKILSVDPSHQMTAKEYTWVLISTNIVLFLFSIVILKFQDILPYRGSFSQKLDLPLILHISSSLITNTCQVHHIPELHLTHLSNFFLMPLLMLYSSATGIAVAISVIRGITQNKIGNAYVDLVRAMIRVLLPLSTLLTLIFTSLGVPNSIKDTITITTLENIKQNIIIGPLAAFEAIKMLGENGLAAFNANSAHPFENPSYITNFLQLISILIIPVALIYTLGFWLKNIKQSNMTLIVLIAVLIFESFTTTYLEINGNHSINKTLNSANLPNWTGKETRLGITASSIFSSYISNVSGATNSALETYHPLTNLIGLFNLSNQSIFGVQGFGTVFTINFILYTAFLVGLMLGKTPEVFGKRIEKKEIILSSILLLLNPILVLFGIIIISHLNPEKYSSIYEQVHYYTQIFYELSSAAASNGSGLERLNDNNDSWNIITSIIMLIARYGALTSMIFLGEAFGNKPTISTNRGIFKTDNFTFSFIFLFMSIISTLLIYLPFFVLGPITEFLLYNNHV